MQVNMQQPIPKSKDFNSSKISVSEFEKDAENKLGIMTKGYYNSGATAQVTLRENISAFNR